MFKHIERLSCKGTLLYVRGPDPPSIQDGDNKGIWTPSLRFYNNRVAFCYKLVAPPAHAAYYVCTTIPRSEPDTDIMASRTSHVSCISEALQY